MFDQVEARFACGSNDTLVVFPQKTTL